MSSLNSIEIDSFQGIRARTVQSYNEANIKYGLQFFMTANWPTSDPIANGSANSRNIIFKTGDKTVLVKTRNVAYVGEEFVLELFEGTTFTGGETVEVGNYNSRTPQPTTVEVYKDVTVTSEGTGFAGEPTYYYGGTSGNRDASAIPDGRERILKPNTTYMVRITSTEGSGRFSYFIDWYEGDTDLPRPFNDE